MKQLILLALLSLFSLNLSAQDRAPIIFIYDSSNSMWGQIDGTAKMEIARDVLGATVNNLPDGQQVGLVAYGHRQKSDCEDVEFLVAMNNNSKSAISQSLEGIKPLGKTPLAYSALQVIDQLRKTQAAATIILITDGIESCGGNLCEVIKAAKAEGINFKLHIVGFGLKEGETEELKCAANAGEGNYRDAGDADDLTSVLDEATKSTVEDKPGNVSIVAVVNGQPVDAFVKAYLQGTDQDAGAARTYRDTGFMYLPPGKYDLEIKPLEDSDIPAMKVTGIQSFEEKMTHKTVSFDGGTIIVNSLNNGEGWDAVVKIFSSGKDVAGGRTYGRAKAFEVPPGNYEVELRILDILGLDVIHKLTNITVKPNEETNASHNFQSGVMRIGAKSGNELVDGLVKIKEVNSKKQVGGGRTYTSESSNPKEFMLIPGTYEVLVEGLKKYSGKKETITLEVKAGEIVEKQVEF